MHSKYSGAAFLQIPNYIVIITASFAVLAAKSLPLAMITFIIGGDRSWFLPT